MQTLMQTLKHGDHQMEMEMEMTIPKEMSVKGQYIGLPYMGVSINNYDILFWAQYSAYYTSMHITGPYVYSLQPSILHNASQCRIMEQLYKPLSSVIEFPPKSF